MKKSKKSIDLGAKDKITHPDRIKTLQSLISCMFYLVKEAEREGFPYVSAVLKNGIGQIDLLSRGGSLESAAPQLIDDSLYEAMSFLHTLVELTPSARQEFMKVFDAIRETFFIRDDKLQRPQRSGLGELQ